jgi:hypothetical protein
MARTMIRIPDEAAFWALGESQPDGCILWTGKTDPKTGYGRMGPALTGSVYAHRSAWLLAYGEIPGELTVEHTCHTDSDCALGNDCQHRRCINPGHMELLPQGDNARRGRRSGGIAQTCPLGHDKRTLPSGQRYCPTCTSAATKAWLDKDGNREIQNAQRGMRRKLQQESAA